MPTPSRRTVMAYTYRIVPEQSLVLIVGSGEVSSKDIYRVVTGFQRDPEWDPSMNMLVDWRRVDSLDIDQGDIARLASDALDSDRMQQGTPLGSRAAVVLASHDHVRIPMLYHSYLRKSGLRSRIFFSMREAADWLAVDLDEVPLESPD